MFTTKRKSPTPHISVIQFRFSFNPVMSNSQHTRHAMLLLLNSGHVRFPPDPDPTCNLICDEIWLAQFHTNLRFFSSNFQHITRPMSRHSDSQFHVFYKSDKFNSYQIPHAISLFLESSHVQFLANQTCKFTLAEIQTCSISAKPDIQCHFC